MLVRARQATKNGKVKCYTCRAVGRWKGDNFQAGHFLAGRSNAVLFDDRQVRVQCYACNICRAGEQFIFGQKLREEVGEKVFSQILKSKNKVVKYSKKDYERMIQEFKEELKELKKIKNLS